MKAKQSQNTENKGIEEAIKDIRSRFGEGAIMKLGEVRRVNVDAIPTGSISLDMALGIGGVPKGRIIEVYGPESSGKTTLALHIVSESQKRGGLAAFVDAEHALDPEYAKKIGVDINNLLISQPDTGEQALEIVETLVKSGAVDIIVIDSVAALTPKAEIEGEMGAHHIGTQARLMSQALRKLTALTSRMGATLIFINQIRMQVGIIFGNPEITPGGKALKFFSSVRIEVRKVAQIKKGEDIVGNRVRVKIVKNKVAPPFKTAEFDIMYNEGISRYSDLINSALKYDLVKKMGSWYAFGEQKLGQGLEASRQFLKENEPIAKKIAKDVKEAFTAAVTEETPVKAKKSGK